MKIKQIIFTALAGCSLLGCKTEQPEGPQVNIGSVSFDSGKRLVLDTLKLNTFKTLSTDTFFGTASSSGNLEIKRGLIWNDSTDNLTMANARDTVFADEGKTTNLGPFSKVFTVDRNNSTIYYRLFVQNAKGVAYTEVKTTRTRKGTPLVKMHAVANFADSIAILQGAVVLDGGDSLTERGFAIGLTATPTIANANPKVIIPGNATGPFQINQNVKTGFQANKKYFVRAYAINKAGLVGYSAANSFTTKE
jgi:hypothetical protein